MSNLSSLRNSQYKIGLGEGVYVITSSYDSGGTTPTVLGDFVRTNVPLSKTTYSNLYARVGDVFPVLNTQVIPPDVPGGITYIAYLNGLYLYSGSNSPNMALNTSTDGLTWTSVFTSGPVTGVDFAYGNSRYVAAGDGTTGTSTNGTSWTFNGDPTYLRRIAFGNGLFVVAGNGGTIKTSTNGTGWQSRTSGTTSIIYSLYYGNGLFVYGALLGGLGTSTDGITWTPRTTGLTSIITDIHYGGGLFAAVTQAGNVSTSTDAITWTTRTTGTSSVLNSITYQNNIWTASGSTIVGSSTDGINWSFKPHGLALYINKHIYADGKIFAAGYLSGQAFRGSIFTTNYNIDSNFIVDFTPQLKIANDAAPTYDNSTGLSYYVKYQPTEYSVLPIGSVVYNYPSHKYFSGGDGYVKSGSIQTVSDYPSLATQIGRYSSTPFEVVQIPGANFNCTSITHGNGLYVAVGASASLVTSTDGANAWTFRSSQATTTINSVTFGNGIFVYGGGTPRLGTSTNGTTWNTVDTGNFQNSVTVVKYLNNIFLAGSQNYLRISKTGTNWGLGNNTVYGSCFANGLFVAGLSGGSIGTSTDGITWTTYYQGQFVDIFGCAYGNGVYVVCGQSDLVRTSTDGITWSAVGTTTTGPILYSVLFANNQFLYAGTSGRISTSTDGTTWTAVTTGTTSTIFSLAYGNNTYVYTGGSAASTTNAIGTSTDGITWTSRTGFLNHVWRSVTFGNGIFLACNNAATGSLYTSTDGITWTARTIGGTPTLQHVNFNNGLFMAGGYDPGFGTCIATSTDAITWTVRTAPNTNTIFSTTYGNGLYLYLGGSGLAHYSSTGTIWNSSITGSITDFAYGNGVYLYSTTNGLISSSTDAITWTTRTSNATNTINGMAFGNNRFVYVGTAGVLGTSTDGITWTNILNGYTNDLRTVTYDGTRFVAAGTNSRVITSTDGINWSLPPNAGAGVHAGTAQQINSLTVGPGPTLVYCANLATLGRSTNLGAKAFSTTYNPTNKFLVPQVSTINFSNAQTYIKAR